MRIQFSEQDVMDAVCVFVAHNELIDPEDVEVDLRFDLATKVFYAITTYGFFGKNHLHRQDLIDAIAYYLASWHNFIPEKLFVDLAFVEGEGIIADISIV